MTIDTHINLPTAPTSSNTISAKNIPLINYQPEKKDPPKKETEKKSSLNNISLPERTKIANALITTNAEQLKAIEGELTIDNVITYIFGEIENNPTDQGAMPKQSRQYKNKTEKKINPRKLELIQLSRQARALIDIGSEKLIALEGELTINRVIKHVFYPSGLYRTFKDWKGLGYSLKGEKGYPIWGRKRDMTKVDKENGDNIEFSAFPLAYIFHESQAKKSNDDKEVIQ
jgi:hypothetical protein